jgi:DNA polymerase elongation subunit (family B)
MMEVFVLDVSYEDIYNSCSECSKSCILQMTCDKYKCGGNPLTKYPNYRTIVISGITSDNKRITLTHKRFSPSFIIKASDYYDGLNVSVIDHELALLRDVSFSTTYMRVYYNSSYELSKLLYEMDSKGIKYYEHDIDIHTQYLTKYKFKIGDWINVKGYENNPRVGIYNLDFDIYSVIKIERDYIITPKVLTFDIECQSHNALSFPDVYHDDAYIAMIGIFINNDTQYVLYKSNIRIDKKHYIRFDTELGLIIGFLKLIKIIDPDVIIGYNNLNFDMSYLYKRMCYMVNTFINISRLKITRGVFKPLKWGSSAYNINDFVVLDTFGILILDVLQYIRREYRFPKYKLDYIASTLLGDSKKGLKPQEMFKHLASSKLDSLLIVADYCIHDVYLTYKIFEHVNMWYGCVEYARLTGAKIHELYTRGENKKIVPQLYEICYNKYVLDTYQGECENIQGALVLEPCKGIYENCGVVDFTSLYPSIIIANNICYSTLQDGKFNVSVKGIIPQLVDNLITQRKKYKQLLKHLDKLDPLYTIYNKRQNSLKIQANSVYGCFGNKSMNLLYLPEAASAVTEFGRQYISLAKEIIENENSQVLYGDTDSCMIKLPNHLTLEESIQTLNNIVEIVNNKFPDRIELALETIFKRAIFVSKKMYAGLIWDNNNIIIKGLVSVRNDRCKFVKDINNNVIRKILEGETRENILRYINEYKLLLLNRQVDITTLIQTTTINENYKNESYPTKVFLDHCKKVYPPGTKLEYIVSDSEEDLLGKKWIDIEYYNSERYDPEYYCKSLDNSLKAIIELL